MAVHARPVTAAVPPVRGEVSQAAAGGGHHGVGVRYERGCCRRVFQVDCRLAIARRKRIESDPTADPLGRSLYGASERHAGIAVSDQHDIVQFVLDEHPLDILDLGLDTHLTCQERRAFASVGAWTLWHCATSSGTTRCQHQSPWFALWISTIGGALGCVAAGSVPTISAYLRPWRASRTSATHSG